MTLNNCTVTIGKLFEAGSSDNSTGPMYVGKEDTLCELPEELGTDTGKEMLSRLQKAGYLDEQYRPSKGVSKIYAALMANEVGSRLGLKRRWSPFEELWSCRNLRNDYQRALESGQSGKYLEEIKHILG